MYPAVQLGKFSDGLANISLRDYFAAQMMAGVFAGGRQIDIAHEVAKQQRALEMNLTERQVALETNKLIATMCYEMSDVMLAERAKS